MRVRAMPQITKELSGCTCVASSGPDDDYADYLRAALLSAKERAPSLIPHLIYQGPENDLTSFFRDQGGTVRATAVRPVPFHLWCLL
jgi:hypothetical protein